MIGFIFLDSTLDFSLKMWYDLSMFMTSMIHTIFVGLLPLFLVQSPLTELRYNDTHQEVSRVHVMSQPVQIVAKKQSFESLPGGKVFQEIALVQREEQPRNTDIQSRVAPSVVQVKTHSQSGSGIVYNTPDTIVTNAHILKGESVAEVIFFDGTTREGTVIWRDEVSDVAVLSVPGSVGIPAFLGDSSALHQGEQVYAFGYPFGVESTVSITAGTISHIIADGSFPHIETYVEMHPGNSGGPLVNNKGEVIGMNAGFLKNSENGSGELIKFVIPINTVKLFVGV
ncbi:MAG: trypsin-like peptidase domain-containing protein [bacterium]|nr:trypsin-like peptidase domain-containing protein [bacterium]